MERQTGIIKIKTLSQAINMFNSAHRRLTMHIDFLNRQIVEIGLCKFNVIIVVVLVILNVTVRPVTQIPIKLTIKIVNIWYK
jgi:hypothetical protein